MKKRILSLLLTIVLTCSLFGGFSVLAANEDKYITDNLLCNGDMELMGTTFGEWHTDAKYVSFKTVRSGERAIKIATTDTPLINLKQQVDGIIPGKEYTFTAYLYVKEYLDLTNEVGGAMKLEFHRAGEENTNISSAAVYQCYSSAEKNKWIKCTISGFAPLEAVYAKVYLRLEGGGEIYWDDATFVGPVTPENYEIIAAKRDLAASTLAHSEELLAKAQAKEARTEIMPGAVNAVTNPSFEEISEAGNYPLNWSGFRSEWGKVTFLSDEKAHTGKYSAKIVGTPDTYQPWVMHSMQGNFVADTEYVLSAWVKAKEIEPLNGMFMKAECYSSTNATGNTQTGSAESSVYKFHDDEWHQIKLVFTMPANTSVVKVYLRTSTGNCVIFYDDVEFGPAASGSVMDFLPKLTFNYTEKETVDSTATISYINNPIEAGSVIEFTVKDGDNIIVQETLDAAPTVNWSFPTMKLAEIGKAYTISAVYKKADGSVIEASEEKRIYRYNRPTMLDEKGQFIVNGKPLDVVVLYGTWEKFYDDYEAAGVTVIRPDDVYFSKIENIDEIRKIMDHAHEHGLKVLYQLYGRAAGHPLQIPITKRLVEEFKDHPALLAWMLMDEPSYQILPGRQAQSYPEILEYLEEGYKVIRAIDSAHPVYTCESRGVPNSYKQAFQFVDIACVDLYPRDNTETTYTYKWVETAVNAVHDEREVWNLGYAHNWYYPEYIPDADGYRMQNYTAMWAGASGIGFYVNDEFTPTLMEVLKQSKDSGELKQMFDHFVRENSPVFDEYLGSDFWQRSWITKDGKMYLVVKEHKNDGKNTEVNFNLKSTNGLIEINGFTAKLVNGTTEKIITSGDSTFKLTMTPTQVSMYEIIPNETVDFSSIGAPVYNDLTGFEWAEDAIINTTKNKIANNKGANMYAPGENITRGDFAMYLIRTLGLDAKTTDQFDDVDPTAEYAKEVAIGKALGILKGSGDGTYNPEEPISRQDLMVICARGLQYVSRIADADYQVALTNFTDKGLIADYATNSIGAMVSSGFITGNPDLTINPLGNTTRAEAAVIMNRMFR